MNFFSLSPVLLSLWLPPTSQLHFAIFVIGIAVLIGAIGYIHFSKSALIGFVLVLASLVAASDLLTPHFDAKALVNVIGFFLLSHLFIEASLLKSTSAKGVRNFTDQTFVFSRIVSIFVLSSSIIYLVPVYILLPLDVILNVEGNELFSFANNFFGLPVHSKQSVAIILGGAIIFLSLRFSTYGCRLVDLIKICVFVLIVGPLLISSRSAVLALALILLVILVYKVCRKNIFLTNIWFILLIFIYVSLPQTDIFLRLFASEYRSFLFYIGSYLVYENFLVGLGFGGVNEYLSLYPELIYAGQDRFGFPNKLVTGLESGVFTLLVEFGVLGLLLLSFLHYRVIYYYKKLSGEARFLPLFFLFIIYSGFGEDNYTNFHFVYFAVLFSGFGIFSRFKKCLRPSG